VRAGASTFVGLPSAANRTYGPDAIPIAFHPMYGPYPLDVKLPVLPISKIESWLEALFHIKSESPSLLTANPVGVQLEYGPNAFDVTEPSDATVEIEACLVEVFSQSTRAWLFVSTTRLCACQPLYGPNVWLVWVPLLVMFHKLAS